jgi:CRP-like cAMP-binding protein
LDAALTELPQALCLSPDGLSVRARPQLRYVQSTNSGRLGWEDQRWELAARSQYDPDTPKGNPVAAVETVGTHLAQLLPNAGSSILGQLETASQRRQFGRRDVLHSRGIQLFPFVVLDGHIMARRVAETGQVYAALIAGAGYFGGVHSISQPEADALYELIALGDGAWATWDPKFVRKLALEDAGLAVDLLDHSSDFTVVLNMRLDERTFQSARQRMATILIRYGRAIFDTAHPVAQRSDLAAMIGTSRVMMYRALRELEAEGLVQRERTGGIKILDEARLADLITVAAPEDAPAL